MTNLLLPPSAWLPGAGAVTATFTVPQPGGVAIRAEGWAEPIKARLLPAEGTPTAFLPLGEGAFAATTAESGATFTIEAPTPPRRCQVFFLPRPAGSPTLALLAPGAIRRGVRRPTYDLLAGRGRVATALAAQELDTALGVVAEMLVVARSAEATRGAVMAVLAHLARYPLARSPSLGAFVAALTE